MESCENVLEDMPTTTETEVFGPLTDSTAQVHLPQAVQSGKLITAAFVIVLLLF